SSKKEKLKGGFQLVRKKTLYLFVLMFILSIALVACGGSEEGAETNDDAPTDAETDAGEETDDGAAGGGEEMTLKFAHEEGQGDVQDLYANKFKELIEEKTDGRISV